MFVKETMLTGRFVTRENVDKAFEEIESMNFDVELSQEFEIDVFGNVSLYVYAVGNETNVKQFFEHMKGLRNE